MKKELFEETLTQKIINSKIYQKKFGDTYIDKDVIGNLINYAFSVFHNMLIETNISTLYALDSDFDLCSGRYSISIYCRFYDRFKFKCLFRIGEIKNVISFSGIDDIKIDNPISWSIKPIKDLQKMKSYIDIFNKVVVHILEEKEKRKKNILEKEKTLL